ncbi:MAG: hypothetical protein Q8O43_05670 [Dehalococcoidia bacterium]|nr:hypothetical protein [Dehalococcoidia bacterium]
MKKVYIFSIASVMTVILAFTSCAGIPGVSPFGRSFPYGTGGGMGPGMMGGGGMGPGMMGGGWGNSGYSPQTGASPLTIDQVGDAVRRYLNIYGGNLVVKEIMNFALNYYAEVEEKDTGIHAMELLIDKYTGQVSPEMGPNIMWNTKYGMMGGGMMGGGYYRSSSPVVSMPVTPEQAKAIAQQFLDANRSGLTVAEADVFYGYYTLHTLKDGRLEGMLSVNGYTGAVWYHTWHGAFIDMKEL